MSDYHDNTVPTDADKATTPLKTDRPEGDPCHIDDGEQATNAGPPGWMAFGVVGLLVISAMMVVVLISLFASFGRW